MTATPDLARTFAHPRGTWLDPSTGEQVAQGALLRRISGGKAVLLGESHTDYEIHRWQLHIAVALHALRPNIALGFEMFPRAKQDVLDDWVAGKLSVAKFLDAVDWVNGWAYDANLYLPLFHFCRQQRLRMLALNCHRPLVTRVGKEGWAAIPEHERDGLTPAADATPAYRQRLFDMMGGPGTRMQASAEDAPVFAMSADSPLLDRFIRAQQTWDRAFACNIARALAEPDPPLVIGIIGRGHLDYGHGTPYQLRDLGINDVAVLVPTFDAVHDAVKIAGIAEAIFSLDDVEPRAPLPPRMQRTVDARAKERADASAKR
jgi:uncharacterized iron-regulated protein